MLMLGSVFRSLVVHSWAEGLGERRRVDEIYYTSMTLCPLPFRRVSNVLMTLYRWFSRICFRNRVMI